MNKTDIYIIKNKINQKVYIGSSNCTTYRWKAHFYKLRTGKHTIEDLQRDFDKYGEDAFECRVLFENVEASMEYLMMKMFKSQNRKYGYNYKDNGGNSQYAIASKWRISKFYWTKLGRASFHQKFPEEYEKIDWNNTTIKINDRYES